MDATTNDRTDELQLQVWLKKWQQILQLHHWDVIAHIRSAKDMGGNDNTGTNEFVRTISSSFISILDRRDYLDSEFPADQEQVLVHELLHLWFCEFEPKHTKSSKHIAWERCIDKMAMFLVKLDRERAKDAV